MTGLNGYLVVLRKKVINKLDEAAKNCCNLSIYLLNFQYHHKMLPD